MTTELIKGRPNLKDTGALQQMAQAICRSEMCPQKFRGKPADAFVAILTGAEAGLPPMASLKNITVINGTPSIYCDGLPAIAYGSGKLKKFSEWFEGEGDEFSAVVEIERKDVEGARRFRFSVGDAKRAHLWDERKKVTNRRGDEIPNPSPWHCYPQRMLQMRARSWGFRDTFADHIGGLHVVEEQQDIPQRVEVVSHHDEALDALGLVPEPAPVEEPSDDIIDAEVEPVQEPPADETYREQMLRLISEAAELVEVEQLKSDVQVALKHKEISGLDAQALLVEIGKKIAELSDGKEEG